MTLYSVEIGQGRPVMILHGGGLDHRHMKDALEPVFEEVSGWRRIYVDLPGHGQSTGDGIENQQDVLDRVRDFGTKIGATYAVIGESRGSLIADGLAKTVPDALLGVCLIVPGGDDETSAKPEHVTLEADTSTAKSLSDAASARFARLVVQTPEIASKIVATKLPAAELADITTAEKIAANFKLSLPPGKFDRPALILSGRQDAIAGWEDAAELHRQYTRATFALLDTAGHSLAWERPKVFVALVRDWLSRMRP